MPPRGGPVVTFREAFSGRFTYEDDDRTVLRLHTAVTVRDLAKSLSDPNHRSGATGRVSMPPLGDDLPATHVAYRTSGYEVGLESAGAAYHLIADRTDFDRLDVRLHKGPDASGPVIGTGTLHLARPAALLWSIRTSGLGNAWEKTQAYLAFLRHVVGGLRG